jgi:NAD(P)-dependent dehydrogenase (short-subunit alcohol dehydrogenase family)
MNTSSSRRPSLPFSHRPDLPIAVVIGAGGLSMAIAQRLGQDHRIVLVSIRAAELELGQARLHELGVISTTFTCDITQSGSVDQLGAFVSGLGDIATLAHVAALSPAAGDWRAILSVNLIGAALVERQMHPRMRSPHGAAVFISSLAAHGPEPDSQVITILDDPLAPDLLAKIEQLEKAVTAGWAYSLSKLGLNRLVQRRAAAWGERGARIVSISPGLIDTPMGALEDQRSSSDSKARLRGRRPLKRDGSMADIADAVEFLTSARASYITGTDLLVDGGLSSA